jgi:hypothetical protein
MSGGFVLGHFIAWYAMNYIIFLINLEEITVIQNNGVWIKLPFLSVKAAKGTRLGTNVGVVY